MPLQSEIRSVPLLYAKAVLFVALAVGSAATVVAGHPAVSTAILLAIAMWASARAYYFVFYVIHRYVDSSYKYSGLLSMLSYLRRCHKHRSAGCQPAGPPAASRHVWR